MLTQGRCLILGVLLLCCVFERSTKAQYLSDPVVIQIKRPDTTESTAEIIQTDKKTDSPGHNITIVGNDFMLDGQSLQIVSGSLHYFRLPAAFWRDRLYKLKAAGLNAVSTYVEWSYHEPEERQYNFDGDRDIATFIKTAAEAGLHVLLRPGPYICAERDLGGIPYWILGKYPNIRLRTTDKDFIQESKIWMTKLFEQLKPLLFNKGGPIILVQVENEYGSYGNDLPYKEAVRDMLSQHVGTDALLYTTDGSYSSYFRAGAVPGALTTIDFGPTRESMQSKFQPLRLFMRSGPLMNSEYYSGWLTHWRETIAQTSTEAVVKTLKDMLDEKINVNFYMFFGGSNFEFTAGANYDGTYQPDITSYDYDAPLSEAGDPTPKYYAIREALKSYNLVDANIDPPQPSRKGNYGTVAVAAKLNLLSDNGRAALGKTYNNVSGSALPTFESLRQRSGLVLYETKLPAANGLLQIQKPRDLIFVFVDGKPVGKISRMLKIYSLPLPTAKQNSVLSLLVENQGRINFGSLIHDYKGILSTVIYDDKALEGWKVTGYPLEKVELERSNEQLTTAEAPTLFEGQFTLPTGQTPLDTFLDTSGWGKGFIWVNGHNLGRYWPSLGPQITLYVPAVWLRPTPQVNLLHILELHQPSEELNVQFIDHPILNRTGNVFF